MAICHNKIEQALVELDRARLCSSNDTSDARTHASSLKLARLDLETTLDRHRGQASLHLDFRYSPCVESTTCNPPEQAADAVLFGVA